MLHLYSADRADVVKVEHPKTGDDTRSFDSLYTKYEHLDFLSINRGKRLSPLDMKCPKNQVISLHWLSRLMSWLKIFVQGVMDKWNLGSDVLLQKNPNSFAPLTVL